MALHGLARVLLGGFDEIDRRRQMRTQEQFRDLQLESMGLQNEALRRQLNAPAPQGLDLGMFVPELAGVQVDPQYADDLIRAYGTLQDQSKDMVDPAMLLAWNRAIQTGDTDAFLEQYGGARVPASAVSALTQMPTRSLEAESGYARHSLEHQPIGEEMAAAISAQTGLPLNPQVTPATLRSILGDDWVDQYVRLAAAPGERERIGAQTRLADIQAQVALGNLELARDTLDWRKFVEQEGFDHRAREFAASEEGRLWRQDFETRKQDFFENLSLRRLAGEEAAREFNEFLARERLALEQQASDMARERFALDQQRFDRDLARDAESDRRWQEEHAFRLGAQEFDQRLRERQQQHREGVDQRRLLIDEERLGLDRDERAFRQSLELAREQRESDLHPYAVQRASAEARMSEQLDRSGTVSLGDLAIAAGVDPSDWPESVRVAPVRISDGQSLASVIRSLRQSDADALQHLPLALRIYETSYGGLTGIIPGAPSFTEFFKDEFQDLLRVAEAIASGAIPPDVIQDVIPTIEETIAPQRKGFSIPRQSVLDIIIDYFRSRRDAIERFRDDVFPELSNRIQEYASGTSSTSNPSSNRSPYYGDLDRVLDEILMFGSPEEELEILRQATPEERQEYEAWYGVPFDSILLGVMQRSAR